VREWRALIAHRQALVGRRVTLQNRLRATLLVQGLPAPRGHRAWTADGVAEWNAWARPLEECDGAELWRGRLRRTLEEYAHVNEQLAALEARLDAIAGRSPAVQLLRTIPGVGPRTAEAVAAYLDDPKRFASAKEVSAYAGLVPRQFQSGETDRRGRITRRGPALLRKALVEAAWLLLRYNGWAARLVQRISRGQKTRRKQALVALGRKLLVRCWAMLRHGTAWDERLAAT
jgi:transposase